MSRPPRPPDLRPQTSALSALLMPDRRFSSRKLDLKEDILNTRHRNTHGNRVFADARSCGHCHVTVCVLVADRCLQALVTPWQVVTCRRHRLSILPVQTGSHVKSPPSTVDISPDEPHSRVLLSHVWVPGFCAPISQTLPTASVV
jgi:hypothetical protein